MNQSRASGTAGSRSWRIWIDRGGTFTDCIGLGPEGTLRAVKVLSSDRAPLEGIRALLGLAPDAAIPACEVRMGTTLATNALLERQGVACGLVITRGFGDLLEIGDQSRPELFELNVRKPTALQRHVIEVDARLDRDGRVLDAPEEATTRAALRTLRARGVDSLAVVVLHAYRNGELERRIEGWAHKEGFDHVSVSHEVAAEIGFLARGETTLVDAYLTPLIRDYLRVLQAELPESSLRVMQSSGGLTDGARFRGRNAILSGPAAGAVATAALARCTGLSQVIGFDMGGTSTDVCRSTGELERVHETSIAGVRLRAPMMDIHTVAAGGGSVCRFDGHRFTVGPQSAGAAPGPLCYGRPEARELTLTDVNLALGRLPSDRFPFALDKARVLEALERLRERLEASGQKRSPLAIAEGFFEIAVDNMAQAIRKVTVARGHDVREHALIVFGGAGGQHACAVARSLGVATIVCHPLAGVLSAFGMGVADVAWHGERDVGRFLLGEDLASRVQPVLDELLRQGTTAMHQDGFAQQQLRSAERVDLRYRGTETALTLPFQAPEAIREAFEGLHEHQFGYRRKGHPVEVVTLRVEVVAGSPPLDLSRLTKKTVRIPPRALSLWHQGRWLDDVPVIVRESLLEEQVLQGPAIVLEDTGTLVVEPGFSLEVAAGGLLLLRNASVQAPGSSPRRNEEPRARLQRDPGQAERVSTATCADPVKLEVFNNRFMSIAEQMGHVLRRTALSTNIRERLDFSCAVFDVNGGLVANAPHIPVHLGAMSESIRALLASAARPRPGEVYASNNPAAGGSHLPDVTVITPVFDGRAELVFFTASRGHHADIGGSSPGSMPPSSKSLEQEGIVLRGLRLVRDGVFDDCALRAALSAGPYPARDVEQNLADLQAQIAANQAGAHLLHELMRQYGLEVVQAYMSHVQDNARAMVEEALRAFPDGRYVFVDALDEGARIRVQLRVDGARLSVDFSDTDPEVAGNLNAPRAVTLAAVLYVLRCLVNKPIPLNSGCLLPVAIEIPQGSLLSPSPHAAVAGGNVETSQRVVDVLLGALGLASASQGTMNNLTFGDCGFGYYETIAGGAGAGPSFHGASAVHTHMTNTRITDAEVLESRFPVRLIRFGVRRGSGGRGKLHGGDGVVRELEALARLHFSILSERRACAPFGLAGGQPGKPGRNLLNGQPLPGKVEFDAQPGDRITIETPGGGGYGRPY
ncbi:MAG: hydantoinase B/oxoprolinase family protein [Proteobacteria bacterium]|nr:hydantoinase B/oxoprolinase family protein [Pseudomonadota bacterium]